jgi:DNA polymerase III delta prime subunit
MLPDDNILNLIIGVTAGLIVILLAWFFREIINVVISRILKTLLPFEAQLQNYRKQLEEVTLNIRHAWMKEGQKLKDILIPVNVQLKSKNDKIEIFNLQEILKKQFSSFNEGKAPRILVLGPPGSGKSVALRVVAKESWNIPTQTKINVLVPVLITFSDFKRADYNLENSIIASLKNRKFFKSATSKKYDSTNFVKNHLYKGNIFVLVDSLDELDVKDRTIAAKHLNTSLKKYPMISAIMSCRSAVYNGHFDDILSIQVEMADFSPMEMKMFTQNWQFDPPKNSTDLWFSIQANPHILELAKNPLTLTIIAYLYSQPKYRLPENRALFYEYCCSALFEEWDQATYSERSNRFDRPHKEFLLGRLAYTHLISQDPDKDIDYRKTLENFSLWMAELGLNPSENTKMLKEIIDNSGLLIFLKPDGLRFPHQTFLEYFTALYIRTKNIPDELISKYQVDPQRWRETLLLYVGLTQDVNNSSKIINFLFENDKIDLTINSLSDSRIFDGNLADRIIDRAEDLLISDPSPDLIRNLGILSSNPHLTLASRVNQMLLDRLYAHKGLSDVLLQELVLSVLQVPTKRSIQFIVDNYKHLNLQKIIPMMAEKEFLVVNQLIALKEISIEKKQEIIKGLQFAGESEILIKLMSSSKESRIKTQIALSLARLSKNIDFWKYINSTDLSQISIENEILNVEKKYGWPFDEPKNIESKRLLYLICYYTANSGIIAKAGRLADFELEDVHPRLAYLIHLISIEGGMPYSLSLKGFVWNKSNKKWFLYLMHNSYIYILPILSFPIILLIIVLSQSENLSTIYYIQIMLATLTTLIAVYTSLFKNVISRIEKLYDILSID